MRSRHVSTISTGETLRVLSLAASAWTGSWESSVLMKGFLAGSRLAFGTGIERLEPRATASSVAAGCPFS
jgi:hypothetical protein